MSFRQSVAAVFAFIALLYAFAFTYPSTELQRDIEAGNAMQAGAATCNQSICDKVCESGKNMKTILTAYLACFSYLSCACGPIPIPNPPEPSVGGQTAAGGATSTGGASFGGRGGTGSLGGSSGVGGASSTPEQAACANLSRLGCPEGYDIQKCSSDMKTRCANPKVKCATQCLIDATSKASITNTCHLACGSL